MRRPLLLPFSFALLLAACDSAPPPASMEAVSPLQLLSPVGREVPLPPSVQVRSDDGRPLANVLVTFEEVEGGGTLTGTSKRTDREGIARVTSWVLGTTAGPNRVRARAAGVPDLIFTAQATADHPAALRVAVEPSSTAAGDRPLARQPQIQLVDEHGNDASRSGVVVSASLSAAGEGGGAPDEVVNATATTDEQGRARFAGLRLAGRMGERTLLFSAPELGSVESGSFTLGPADPDRLALLQAPPSEFEAGLPIEPAPVVQLRDRFLNDVPRAGVEVRAVITGGGVRNGTVETDEAGQAHFEDLIVESGTSGERNLSFQSSGLTAVSAPPVMVQGRWPVGLHVTPAGAPDPVVSVNGQSVGASDPPGTVTARNGVAATVEVQPGTGGSSQLFSHWTWVVFDESHPDFEGLEQIESDPMAEPAHPAVLHHSAPITGASSQIPASRVAGPLLIVVSHAPPPPALLEKRSGDGQTADAGQPVAVRPRVRVLDGSGSPVEDATVRFSVIEGGGAVTGATPRTDGGGEAAVGSWILGSGAGTNRLRADLPDHPGVPAVVFTATATAVAPAYVTAVAGDNQVAPPGSFLPIGPTVVVQDLSGNPVPGIPVEFEITGGGGTLTAAVDVTNQNGGAQVGWTLGPDPGENTVRASMPSHPGLPSVTFTATGDFDQGGGDLPTPPPAGGHSAGWEGPNTLPLRIIEGGSATGTAVVLTVIADGESRSFHRLAVNQGLTVGVPRGADLQIIAHFEQAPAAGVGHWGFSSLKLKALHKDWGFEPWDIHHGNPGEWEPYTHNDVPGQAPATWFGHLRSYCGTNLGPGPLPNFWTFTIPGWISANPDTHFLVAWMIDHQIFRASCPG